MFANRLKSLRLSKGLNQVQLAERLGVKKQSISNWENDNIMPSVDMLEKIATYFCVSTDYVLGRESTAANGILTLDVTGLTPVQIEHLNAIIDDFRRCNS